MNEKQPRKGPKWLTDALELVSGIRGLLLLAGGLVAGGGGMKAFGDAGVTRADSLKLADSVATARVAPLKAEVAAAKEEAQAIREESRAAFGALMDALPAFKKAVHDRSQANAEAARRRAETDTLLNNLTEAK